MLKRKIMMEMMTTNMPFFLLMMTTFATTFFKSLFFEAALTLNLTDLLVMTTNFTSVMENFQLEVLKYSIGFFWVPYLPSGISRYVRYF